MTPCCVAVAVSFGGEVILSCSVTVAMCHAVTVASCHDSAAVRHRAAVPGLTVVAPAAAVGAGGLPAAVGAPFVGSSPPDRPPWLGRSRSAAPAPAAAPGRPGQTDGAAPAAARPQTPGGDTGNYCRRLADRQRTTADTWRTDQELLQTPGGQTRNYCRHLSLKNKPGRELLEIPGG